MVAGVLSSVLLSVTTNMAFGSAPSEYIAFLIGDIFGLLFLMLGLFYAFRFTRPAD